MTKSASGNPAFEQGLRDKYQFITAFLVVQAMAIICLALYLYHSVRPEILAAAAAWACCSLAMAALLIRLRFIEAAAFGNDAASASADPLVFGVPNRNLDLASLCSLMQEGVALVRQGEILYVNPAFSYIIAAEEEEILGTRVHAYVHPEDTALLPLDGLVSTNGPSRATLRLKTRLGDERWVICSVHQVEWEEEEATLLLFENIGPLKQAQLTVAEQEYQSRVLLERTPLGVAMFDAMGQLKTSNTAWHSIWSGIVGSGQRRFNILQEPFLPNTSVERAIRQAFSKKDSGISNFEYAAPWGETRWLNLNFHPMTDPMGGLIGVAMIQQDVTDQIRSVRRENELNDQLTSLRHQLSYSENFYGEALDMVDYVVINLDSGGTITGWNRCAEARFGLGKNLALGRNYKRLEIDFGPYAPLLQETLSTGEPLQKDCQQRFDQDGPHFERISTFTINNGFTPVVFLVIRDITCQVLSDSMHGALSRYAALESMGRVFTEVLDFSSTPPFLHKKPGAVEQLEEFCNSIRFLSEHGIPSARLQPINLHHFLQKITPSLKPNPDTALDLRLEPPKQEHRIMADESLLQKTVMSLSGLLLQMECTSAVPNLTFRCSHEPGYALLNISTNGADQQDGTDLAALAAILERNLPGFETSPLVKEMLEPLQNLAACGGILGGYSTEELSGFVCRFPLAPNQA